MARLSKTRRNPIDAALWRVVVLNNLGNSMVLEIDSMGRSGRAELEAHVGVPIQLATVMISTACWRLAKGSTGHRTARLT